jgi:hypothetical protein
MEYSIWIQRSNGEMENWDQYPEPLEPFPSNSLEVETPLFVEFQNQFGTVTYVTECRLVSHRLLGKTMKQMGVSVETKQISQ